jgi:hypothetical protein
MVRLGPVLTAVVLAALWSCSGASTQAEHAGAAGTGGASSAGGSPSAAGTAGVSRSGAAPGGGGATAGLANPTAGSGGGAPGNGGAGGATDPLLGVSCDSARCAPGQACVHCRSESAASSERICVPHPVRDPDGYAAATAGCLPTTIYDDCDGPEDCASGEFCVAREAQDGFMRCRSMPAMDLGSCCFSCGAPTSCTLCRTSDDCPDERSCEPVEIAGLMGCH